MTRCFALTSGGALRLEVSWDSKWSEIPVVFDGIQIGTVPGFAGLKKRPKFILPDGSTLQLGHHWLGPTAECDGVPLVALANLDVNDPVATIRRGRYLLFALGALSFASAVFGVGIEVAVSLCAGALYIGMGWLGSAKPRTAFTIALFVLAADLLGSLVLTLIYPESLTGIGPWAFITRLVLLTWVARANQAARLVELRARARQLAAA